MFTFDVFLGSLGTIIFGNLSSAANGSRYSKMDQLNFVEDSFSKILLCPFFNTLTQIILEPEYLPDYLSVSYDYGIEKDTGKVSCSQLSMGRTVSMTFTTKNVSHIASKSLFQLLLW